MYLPFNVFIVNIFKYILSKEKEYEIPTSSFKDY